MLVIKTYNNLAIRLSNNFYNRKVSNCEFRPTLYKLSSPIPTQYEPAATADFTPLEESSNTIA